MLFTENIDYLESVYILRPNITKPNKTPSHSSAPNKGGEHNTTLSPCGRGQGRGGFIFMYSLAIESVMAINRDYPS